MNCPTLSFSESFFHEEVRSGVLVTRATKEIWAVELDLLAKLQQVCEKHQISFFVDGGTMLGTVRHKGFIPWDDDIDVSMTREEYIKLCRIAPQAFTEPYFFQTEQTDPGSLRGHAQIRNNTTTGVLVNEKEYHYSFNQGIFIDVFPYDSIPEDKKTKAKFIRKTDRLRELARMYAAGSSRYNSENASRKKKIFYYLVGKWIKKNPFYVWYEKALQKYNKSNTSLIANLFLPSLKDSFIYKKWWIEEFVTMPFEMLTVQVPIGHKEYLRNHYGNWEEPVKSGSLHGDVIFDVDLPYIEFLKKQ